MTRTTKLTYIRGREETMVDAGSNVDIEIMAQTNFTFTVRLKGPRIDIDVEDVTRFKLEHVIV